MKARRHRRDTRRLMGALIALPALLMTLVVLAAEPQIPLSHPASWDDPRWRRLLPALKVPLDKPAELAAQRPSPTLDAPDPSRTDEIAPLPLAPERKRQDSPPRPPTLAARPGDGDAGTLSAQTPKPDTTARVQVSKETEDSAMIEILETLAVTEPNSETVSGELETTAPVTTSDTQNDSAPAGIPTEASHYRWHVQLLAGRSLERVKEDRRLFVRHYSWMLRGLTLTISQSHYGDARDAFYRLRAADWTSKWAAIDWCDHLIANDHQCLVIRIAQRAE